MPLPFGKMVFAFGEPIYPVKDGRRLSTAELKDSLERGLVEITECACKEIAKIVQTNQLRRRIRT